MRAHVVHQRLPYFVAAALPLERLLIETDCPLLAPVPHRGKRNEPAYVVHVAETLAQLHHRSREDIGRCTHARTRQAFRLGESA